LLLVGALATGRDSSFNGFPQQKPDGVTRVCAFGDSFTYGDEVVESADYPSLLAGLIRREGIPNVEVLNFGSSWHGFHQTFMLWERAGLRYGCNYALLGPGSFWELRSTAFNHTDLISPYYLHARYVLEGDDVTLVKVVGDDYYERFDGYWGFVPNWRTLRYDRNAPAFLKAVIPKGRSLPNPFYYRSDTKEEESLAIWRVLLRKMGESDMPIVLTNMREGMVELADSLGLPAVRAWGEYRFPYRARRGHHSVWGNQMIAGQYFSAIVEGDAPEAFRIVTTSRRKKSVPLRIPQKRPLFEYRSLVVQINRRDAGIFATASENFEERGLGSRAGFLGTPVHSLLAILEPGESLFDAAFVPLPFELEEGALLRLHVEVGGESSDFATARVRMLDPLLNIGVAEIPSVEFRRKEQLVLRRAALTRARQDSRFELILDGNPILAGSRADGDVVFRQFQGALFQIVSVKMSVLEVERMPQSGAIHLRLEHDTDGAFRVPLGRWKKVPVDLSWGGIEVRTKLRRESTGGKSSFFR
jgi:hypothetical protein